jgi:putative NADH-flavin reductase
MRQGKLYATAVFCILTVLFAQVFSSDALTHEGTEPSGITVLIIGGTARTANDLIPQALWRGHNVVALARRPYRVRHAPHPRLKVVKGDVYDKASIEAALSGDGSEVVISLYGGRQDPSIPTPITDIYSQGTTNIIEAMKAKGNMRLVVTTSMAAPHVAERYTNESTELVDERIWLFNLRGPYLDMLKMEEIVKVSGLDYIIWRPGQLIIEPARGDLKLAVDDEPVPSRRVVTYADSAAWILDQVESDDFLYKTVSTFSDIKMSDMEGMDFESAVANRRAAKAEADADLARDAAAAAKD